MSLTVTGLSHHTSDVELRERLAFPEAKLPAALLKLKGRWEDAGVVILSTCNRSEIYISHPDPHEDLHRNVTEFLSEWHEIDVADFNDALYQYHDSEAYAHLFRVVSSLDSLVVGEQQISGQVHDAYRIAHAEHTTDKVLNALFQRAFTVAKKVRSQSDISLGKVSISSVAVELAVNIFMDFSDKTIMVVGSGEMSELTLSSLMDRGASTVIVANRTIENARELADKVKGTAIALSDIDQHLAKADIVISSTAAPGIVLTSDHFQRAVKQRAGAPIFAIDIAVPRDIDAAVNDIDNVYLYDVDDLEVIAAKNLEARRAEVDRCMEYVDTGVKQFEHWHKSLAVEPTIISLSKEVHALGDQELAKTLARLESENLSEAAKEEIAYMMKRFAKNVLQQPLAHLKNEAHQDEHGRVIKLVQRLFGLKEGG